MSVLPACMYINCMHAEFPQRSEEVLGFPETAVKDSYEPLLDIEPMDSARGSNMCS